MAVGKGRTGDIRNGSDAANPRDWSHEGGREVDDNTQTFELSYLQHVARRLAHLLEDPVLAPEISDQVRATCSDALQLMDRRVREPHGTVNAPRALVQTLDRAHHRVEFATDAARYFLENPSAYPAAAGSGTLSFALNIEIEDFALAALAITQ